MIIDHYDNVNFILKLSPQELKVLRMGLEKLEEKHFEEIALDLRLSHFRHSKRDVLALLHGMNLTLALTADCIRRETEQEENIKVSPTFLQ